MERGSKMLIGCSFPSARLFFLIVCHVDSRRRPHDHRWMPSPAFDPILVGASFCCEGTSDWIATGKMAFWLGRVLHSWDKSPVPASLRSSLSLLV